MLKNVSIIIAALIVIAGIAACAQAAEKFISCDGKPITGEITQEELNFDGHQDVSVIREVFAKTILSNRWLWNGEKKCYQFNRALSDLPNLGPDQKTKALISHTNDGHAGLLYTSRTYRFEGSNLVLILEEQETMGTKEETFLKTVKRRIKGKMEAVSFRMLTREEAIKELE